MNDLNTKKMFTREMGAVLASLIDIQKRYAEMDIDFRPLTVVITLMLSLYEKLEIAFIDEEGDDFKNQML